MFVLLESCNDNKIDFWINPCFPYLSEYGWLIPFNVFMFCTLMSCKYFSLAVEALDLILLISFFSHTCIFSWACNCYHVVWIKWQLAWFVMYDAFIYYASLRLSLLTIFFVLLPQAIRLSFYPWGKL